MLVWCGTELLTERGFQITGIDEVLKRVGIPKGLFYHFFKSKDAVKEKTSLVFIVTPKSYDPSSRSANSSGLERSVSLNDGPSYTFDELLVIRRRCLAACVERRAGVRMS